MSLVRIDLFGTTYIIDLKVHETIKFCDQNIHKLRDDVFSPRMRRALLCFVLSPTVR